MNQYGPITQRLNDSINKIISPATSPDNLMSALPDLRDALIQAFHELEVATISPIPVRKPIYHALQEIEDLEEGISSLDSAVDLDTEFVPDFWVQGIERYQRAIRRAIGCIGADPDGFSVEGMSILVEAPTGGAPAKARVYLEGLLVGHAPMKYTPHIADELMSVGEVAGFLPCYLRRNDNGLWMIHVNS